MNEYKDLKPGQWWGVETVDGGVALYNILEHNDEFLVFGFYKFWEDGHIQRNKKETLTKNNYETSSGVLRNKVYIIDSHLMRETIRLMFGGRQWRSAMYKK